MNDDPNYIITPVDVAMVELMKEFPSRSVTLTGLKPNTDPRPSGSGTLVSLEDKYYILTAAHCAEELVKWEEIGLPIRRDKRPFTFPVVEPIYVNKRKSDEWGPDLAFLPIPSVKARDIFNYTNFLFYYLGRYRDEMLQGSLKLIVVFG